MKVSSKVTHDLEGNRWHEGALLRIFDPILDSHDIDYWPYKYKFERCCIQYRIEAQHPARDGWIFYQLRRWQTSGKRKNDFDTGKKMAPVTDPQDKKKSGLTHEHCMVIRDLWIKFRRKLESRHHLPYTTNFEDMYTHYQTIMKWTGPRQEFWRLIFITGTRKMPEGIGYLSGDEGKDKSNNDATFGV